MEVNVLGGDEQQRNDAKDPLEGSEILAQVIGDALPALELFHVKLFQEGAIRGIIGPRETNIIWERHILNSAAVVAFIREGNDVTRHNRIADVGSGGGFPGLVVAACLPDADITLIEPIKRRVDWLDECTKAMGLTNVQIIRASAQEVSSSIEAHALKPFDVVTCRALAPMSKLAGLTLPLLVPGGRLVALKGSSASIELEKAKRQIKHCHGVNAAVKQAEVGPGLDPTHVIIVEKQRR